MNPENEVFAYGVYKNSDQTEGRGPMVCVAMFSTEELAWKFTDGKRGIMGRLPSSGNWRGERYGDWQVYPHRIFRSIEESDNADSEIFEAKKALKSAQEKLDRLQSYRTAR